MEMQMMEFTPVKAWGSIEGMQSGDVKQTKNSEASLFQSVFQDVVSQVYSTQAEVEETQYLLATGQLDDAHTLPIAESKAALSLDLLISLRNKAMESYSELMRINV